MSERSSVGRTFLSAAFDFVHQISSRVWSSTAFASRYRLSGENGSTHTVRLYVRDCICDRAGCASSGNSGYNTPLRMSMVKRGFMLGFVALVTMAVSAPWSMYAQPQGVAGEEARVPAFNPSPPPKGTELPPILTRDQLWGNNDQYPFQSHAYELAAKIQNVIYQQPCYCYCDRGMGHKSLHSCFEGTHGAICSTCVKELYYSYQMTKQHKTASQIRKGIIAGEWKQIDLQTATAIQ